uniref:Integrase catalytic domain-containing protein n=1 Tax=Heterorhabditis bacteriophora TaxID=37862 RepID=A0A1I7WVD9_HETBA
MSYNYETHCIPRDGEAIRLLTLKYYMDYQHSCHTYTLALLHQRYWIPRAHSIVKGTLYNKYMECRRRTAKPLSLPEMSLLPAIRVNPAIPFDKTGADYCGRFTVTREGEERCYNIWITLFTCLVKRTIHLEMVTELCSETFINAFRRFVVRRGCPSLLLTDNGTNFCGTAELVTSLWP